MKLRMGTRGSALARTQSGMIADVLASAGFDVETIIIRTTGDDLAEQKAPILGKGVFTKELDEALLDRRIDVAVHSLKDLPSEMPEGLALAAVPKREDPRDALILRAAACLRDLPAGARLGTGSPRRIGQIRAIRPDIRCLEARGNVDTRIRRLHEGHWDGIVLAMAGLNRLGRASEVTEPLGIDSVIPAPGQGALAIVTRADSRGAVAFLDDAVTRASVACERTILARLEGGCRAPLAAHARIRNGRLEAVAAVFSEDGSAMLRESGEGELSGAEDLGRSLAERLLARGAAAIVAAARSSLSR